MIKILQALISKFFNAFLQAFLNHLVAKIGTTAEKIVALANDLNKDPQMSGTDKAKKLAEQIKVLAISTGKDVPNSLVNLIVETAVSVLKGGV